MAVGPNQAGPGPRPFWRRLVSALAIYALVMQPLLLTIAGSQFAQAAAFDDIALTQLCLHNADGSPVAPSDQKNPSHHHCVQCFAGAFNLLDAPQPITVASVDQRVPKVPSCGTSATLVPGFAIFRRPSERPSDQCVMQCSLLRLSKTCVHIF